MQKFIQHNFSGERAMFGAKECEFELCTFEAGESPLKHGANLRLKETLFKWKYPLWYVASADLSGCTLFETARAGIWYGEEICLQDCIIEAPKTFRRCKNLTLKNIDIPNAAETLWHCRNVEISGMHAKGDYFAMNCSDVRADGLNLIGNYSFDGARNVEIRNSRLLSKDAFWNAENIVVYDSFISGEYLGWNSKNITLINCVIESLQGMCYIKNIVIKGCKTVNTTLAFEYSSVDAEILNEIDSVKNPLGGSIRALNFGEIILEENKIDPAKTEISKRI